MNITLEKNIPLPSTMGRIAKYPLANMEVGDSFAVTGVTERTRMAVLASARAMQQRGVRTIKLASRKIENGFRFWRVA